MGGNILRESSLYPVKTKELTAFPSIEGELKKNQNGEQRLVWLRR